MLAPTLALLTVFFLLPIGVAAYESLFSWDMLTPPRFVGAANYRQLAAHGELYRIALRTLSYSVLVVAGTMTLGLALAIVVNRRGASSRSCGRASSARTSSAGSPWRSSGCGCSTAARAWLVG